MEWLNKLNNHTVSIDTVIFIYFLEQNPRYFNLAKGLFESMDMNKFSCVTSMITLLEVLVHPLRLGNKELADNYRSILLDTNNLDVLEVDQKVSEKAAELRSKYNIRTPDSIQIATGICNDASFFITNDTRLPSLNEIEIVVLETLIDK